MDIDVNHDEIEKVSYSSMHLAILHPVAIDNITIDLFSAFFVFVNLI